MLFNSQLFVFLFLPIVFIAYYGLHSLKQHVLAKVVLILASLAFYAYNHKSYLIILTASIVFNYFIYIVLQKINRFRGLITFAGVVANIAVIFYFKYFDFFITNSNRFFNTNWNTRNILLPLGISFYTFQQVSFLIDAYKREIGEYGFIDYALFVSFFPQLVAGPIVLHNQLIPQFQDKNRYHIDANRMYEGIRYFVIGLFKKTLIADRFGRVVDLGYMDLTRWDSLSAIFIILGYTLQIYFDFSGYSDMAIGLGRIFGVEIPKNFDMPYKATNISEFWKRWHMTMTGFFTKYVYFPLGGSRKGMLRTYVNILIVFAVSGLWHGAAWSFVEWGILHGIAQVIHRVFADRISKMPKIITGFVTFCFVNIAWILFRAGGMYQVKELLMKAFTGGWNSSVFELCNAFANTNQESMMKVMNLNNGFMNAYSIIATVVILALVLLVIFIAPSSHELACRKNEKTMSIEGVILAVMAIASVMTFMNVSTFLYFNF